jgi:hypothetical protein
VGFKDLWGKLQERERREGYAKDAKENQRKSKMEKVKVLDFYTKMATAPSHLKSFGIPFAPFA